MLDLQPIALCNVAYKILAKLLANRLKRLLPGIISECQGAFISGRSIIDNVMLAFEISHSMHQKRNERNGLAALKLDISKEYDCIESGFLKAIMLRMGFNETWVDRIMFCVSTVSYTVCHNGEPISSVVPQRGLRQGDPLSPYLFILCAEGLSSLLQAKVDQGMIHGYSVARNSPQISHPFFADDSYLFFRANIVECQIISQCLEEYAIASGQSINLSKSSLMFNKNVQVFSYVQ